MVVASRGLATRIRVVAVALAVVAATVGFVVARGSVASAATFSVGGISPTSDFVTGGATATITGSGFSSTGALSVTFGAAAPIAVTPTSDTSLSVEVPAASASGAITVTVTLTPTSGTPSSATTSFTYVAAPVVTSIVPTSGPASGGNDVVVTGTGFDPTGSSTVVNFGTTAATVTNQSDTSLTATAPAGTGPQPVTVVVTLTGGAHATSAPQTYTYVPAPTVTSIAPSSAGFGGGSAVTLTGTDFQPGARVFFGPSDGSTNLTVDQPAAAVSWRDVTTLVAITPPGVVGATNVVVQNPDGQHGALTASATGHFTYTGTAPSITSVSPTSGSSLGATSITVEGAGFSSNADLEFVDSTTVAAASNGVDVASFSGAGTLNVASAAGFPVSGALSVATSAGHAVVSCTGLSATAFTGCTTTSGAGTLATGADVSASTAAQGVTVTSDAIAGTTTITATTPAHPAGAVTLEVKNIGGGVATSAGAFTFVAATPPTVTAVSVTSGTSLGGTSLTVTGAHFSAGTSVIFGGVRSTSAAVLSSTTLQVVAPAHPAGVVALSVQLPDGQSASLSAAYTYNAAPAPTIASVTPTSGPGGTQITIGGAGFANTNAATANAASDALVSVGSTPCDPTAALTTSTCLQSLPGTPRPPIVQSGTTIKGVVPAAPGGATTITVTNPDGQSVTTSFTYTGPTGPPTLSAVTPTSAGTLGGTTVTLTGSELVNGATVTFFNSAVSAQGTGVVVNAAGTSLSAVTPAGLYGVMNVEVTNPGGLHATLSDAFTFATSAAPHITSISPASGPNCTFVTLTGTGFANVNATATNAASAAEVTIGGQVLRAATACPTSVAASSNGVDVSSFAGAGTLDVTSTLSFASQGTLQVDTSAGSATLTYTGVTATSFTGVTTTLGSGTLATGGHVAAVSTTPSVQSGTTITGIVPKQPSGSVDVAVMNPDGQGDILVGGYNYPADTVAPTITATGNGGSYTAGSWSQGSVSIALSADDGTGSGVASITYASTGAQTIPSTTVGVAATSLAITAQGVTTVTYSAVDVAGNVSATSSFVVKIDSVAPALSVVATTTPGGAPYTPGTSTNQNVQLAFTCTDAGSGVSSITDVTTATGSNTARPSTSELDVTVTSPGLGTSVTGTCTDAAGNTKSLTFSPINIVTTVPTISYRAWAGGAPYTPGTWTNQSVTVTFTCVPVSSSLPILALTSPVQVSGPVTNDAVTGTCTDSAGNTQSVTVSGIDISRALPTLTVAATTTDAAGNTVAYAAGTWTRHNVVVTFTCTSNNGSAVVSSTPSVTVSANGTTSAVVGDCTDAAGNRALQAFFGPILIDKVPPVCTVALSPSPLSPANSKMVSVQALVKVSDAASGPDHFTLTSVTSNSPSTLANDVAGFAIGTASTRGQLRATKGRVYTLTYQGVDVAGNASLCSTTVSVG